MERKFKVALAQMMSEVSEVEKNLEKMIFLVERAKEEDADLVVFPEMCLTGYMVLDGRDFENFFRQAERLSGPSVSRVSEECKKRKIHAVFGMPLRSETVSGIVFNSAVLVDSHGFAQAYHKTHLPTGRMGNVVYNEALYAQAGDSFPLMETEIGRIGLEVCHDVNFPEVTRIYAVKGAEVVINISAGPSDGRISFETLMPARAFENACYFIYVNIGGDMKGLRFFGASRVLNPIGLEVVKCADEKEDFQVGEIDLDAVQSLRRLMLHFRDRNRRPEIYAELLKQYA